MKLTLIILLLSCACHRGPTSPPAEPPRPPPPPAGPQVSLVTSEVVIEECANSKQLDSKRAAREVEELVGPCTKVPGGAAHFSATLRPDGSVELASPSGDPNEGVVPTCLVQTQQQLRHKLRLTKPCKFDVKLEQRTTSP
jgi:hypothetical protein